MKKIYKFFSITMVFAIIFFMTSISNVYAQENNKVTFKDYNFERLVREVIGKETGDIYENDLLNITEINTEKLEGDYRDIENIEGVGYLRNLNFLNIGNANISDMSPIINLTKLRFLSLYGNKIKDISCLNSMTSLTSLTLWGNSIEDISQIDEGNLGKSLSHLNLGKNPIKNFEPLSNMQSLTSLYLWKDNLENLSFISKLYNLHTLNVENNYIKDLSYIKDLPKLEELYISNNLINNINDLEQLNNLEKLYLQGNNIKDYGPIRAIYNNLQEKDFTIAENINLDKDNINILKYEKSKINCDVTPYDADNRNYNWNVNDENIIDIDSEGNIIGKSEGKTLVLATTEDGGLSAACNITVEDPYEDIESKEIEKRYKTWNIKFSSEIDKKSISDKVKVLDMEGNEVKVNVYCSGDKLVITSPVGGYKNDRIYVLLVSEGINSIDGSSLGKGYEMKFSLN